MARNVITRVFLCCSAMEPRNRPYPISSWKGRWSSTPRATHRKTTNRNTKAMKKLLVIALALSAWAFVPMQRSDAQTTILVPRSEGLSFGFPSGYYAYPRHLNYYPYGYSGHPYVHYYPYAGNPYSYYSAPPSYRGHRTYHRQHRHHHHHSQQPDRRL